MGIVDLKPHYRQWTFAAVYPAALMGRGQGPLSRSAASICMRWPLNRTRFAIDIYIELPKLRLGLSHGCRGIFRLVLFTLAPFQVHLTDMSNSLACLLNRAALKRVMRQSSTGKPTPGATISLFSETPSDANNLVQVCWGLHVTSPYQQCLTIPRVKSKAINSTDAFRKGCYLR